jgi:hypothetical protein
LVVPGRPEFSFFPLDILFSSFARINGILKCGFAFFKPVIEGFTGTGDELKMPYRNIYDRDPKNIWKVAITYNKDKGIYCGEKFRNETAVSMSTCDDWPKFLGYWTAHGLSNAESCYFRPVDD